MTACRICGSAIHAFMSFGQQPIANGFLTPDQIPNEYFFEMETAYCETCLHVPAGGAAGAGNECSMATTPSIPAPRATCRPISVNSPSWCRSASSRAARTRSWSSWAAMDGIMLRHFKERGPAPPGHRAVQQTWADVARASGINTISEFFNKALAERIVAEHGHADAVLSANVMCHIPDLNSVAEGIRLLLKPDGVLMFEDPYLGDVVTKTSYDQIYDEHVFVFSASSCRNAFGRHGLELIDVLPQITHGARCATCWRRKVAIRFSPNVRRPDRQRESARPGPPGRLSTLQGQLREVARDLMRVLNDLPRQGQESRRFMAPPPRAAP